MTDDLILTLELARRMEQAGAWFLESRFRGLATLQSNPLGINVRHVGGAVVATMKQPGGPIPNLVLNLSDDELDQIEEVLDPLLATRSSFIINICPLLVSEPLLRRLAAHGLYNSGFLTETYGLPRSDFPPPPPSVTIREFHGDAVAEFAEIVTRLDNVPDVDRAMWKAVRQAEFTEWRGYVAFVDGVPAARGAMGIHDGIATLGAAVTHPVFRGRGCQTALLQRRIADAAEAGCDLITSAGNPGKTSLRNQQRVGLRIAYTRAEWTPKG